jgi:hypothetical protein
MFPVALSIGRNGLRARQKNNRAGRFSEERRMRDDLPFNE